MGSTRCGFIAFDLETTGLIEEGLPLPEVLCAATMIMRRVDDGHGRFLTEPTRTWPSRELEPAARPPRPMDTAELLQLVDYLWEYCGRCDMSQGPADLRVLAWNGIGYDFKLLHMHFEASPHPRAAYGASVVKQLALASCDPMLAFVFGRGFPVGLQATASVLPSGPMYKNGSGADCQQQWLEGTDEDRLAVLHYCANDVEMTAGVFASLEATGSIRWCAKSGKLNEWRPAGGRTELCAPVDEIMARKFADNSFMRRDRVTGKLDPSKAVPTKAQFVGWLSL